MVNFLQGKGSSFMAFFAFLPAIGEAFHCTGFMRSVSMAYGSFHVCRQVDTLHPSPVCAGKCMECGSRINVSLSNQAISIR